jgi:hypothetical protein
LAKLAASRRAVLGQQIGGHAPAGLILEIKIEKPLAILVPDDEASVVHLIDCPGRRETAGLTHFRRSTPHDACGTIRFVGNYQLQAGRPSGSRAKVAIEALHSGLAARAYLPIATRHDAERSSLVF